MKEKKYIIWIVMVGIMVVLVGALLYKFIFIKPPAEKQEVGQSKTLTQEERQEILGNFNKEKIPIPEKEKKEIINTFKKPGAPLSDMEKQEIIKNFNK